MTFWLDAHLDPNLAPWLGATFKVVAKHLKELDLMRADDLTIFQAARKFGDIVIVSKDQDFIDLVKKHGKPPQILRLSLGNMSLRLMQVRFASSFQSALQLLQSGEEWVEIA